MFARFYPDAWEASSQAVDYEGLYAKGYRGVIFDIDNTLVPHGAPADEQARGLFMRLRAIGLTACLISNNQAPRVAPFAGEVGAFYVCNAHKPSVKAYLRACEEMSLKKEEVFFVGDQLFTDIWGAKRAGLYNILVQPIHPREEIQIILKRRLEWIVLFFYRRREMRKGRRDFPKGHFQSDS